VARSYFFPPDDVTVGEWHYLMRRYSAEEAQDRRERLSQTIKRLVRKGRDPAQLHRALLAGIDRWHQHDARQMNKMASRKLNAQIKRARRDVGRAIASLRQLLPSTKWVSLDDDGVFALRDALLTPTHQPSTRQRGRPWEWKQATDEALRQSNVVASDRRELMSAIGFLEEDLE